MPRHLLLAAVLVGALVLTGCGQDPTAQPTSDVASEEPTTGSPAGAMCARDVPDCVDTPIVDDPSVDVDPVAAKAEAEAILGVPEDELPPDVRVGRRGEEHLMLTEDYVIGRITVDLDDDGSGTYVVSAATVELPEGPVTVTP